MEAWTKEDYDEYLRRKARLGEGGAALSAIHVDQIVEVVDLSEEAPPMIVDAVAVSDMVIPITNQLPAGMMAPPKLLVPTELVALGV